MTCSFENQNILQSDKIQIVMMIENVATYETSSSVPCSYKGSIAAFVCENFEIGKYNFQDVRHNLRLEADQSMLKTELLIAND